jgi:hypothetical protein
LWTVLCSFFLITRICYCWHNLGTVWLLFYYWTSKLINVLLSPSFPNSHHLRANLPNYKGQDPRYKWAEKSMTCNKHVGFKALCTLQIRVIVRLWISTSSLFRCCWMPFEAVLGNTEFELVVFWSEIRSGNKACSFYLVSVTGRVDFT